MSDQGCCCKEEEEPDDPDGPIIDSGCCGDHADIMTISVEMDCKLNWTRRNKTRCDIQDDAGTVERRLVGTITWNLIDDVVTWSGIQFEKNYEVCTWNCPGVGCNGADCYECCPAQLVKRIEGFGQNTPEQSPFIELSLVKGPINTGNFNVFQCPPQYDRDDEDACWIYGNFNTIVYNVDSSFDAQTDCEKWYENNDERGPAVGKSYGPSTVQFLYKIDRDQSGYCTLGDLYTYVFALSPYPIEGSGPADRALQPPPDEFCDMTNYSGSSSWFETVTNGPCTSEYGGTNMVTLDLNVQGTW